MNYLSDMPWTLVNGIPAVNKNLSYDSNPLTINGITYKKGLGVHAPNTLTYTLNGKYDRFRSNIGVDNECWGLIIFKVYTDNVLRYTSPVMGPKSNPESIDLDLTGVNSLKLVVEDGNNDGSCDHGDWADAKVSFGKDTVVIPEVIIPNDSSFVAAKNSFTISKHDRYLSCKYGLMSHWSCGSEAIQQYADSINVYASKFANQVKQLGFDHFVLVTFHGTNTTLFPLDTMDTWRQTGKYSANTDALGKLIVEFKKNDIPILLFTHPLDGHDYSIDQQAILGWNDSTGHYKKWNDYINDCYAQIVTKYGRDLMGIGFDSEWGLSGDVTWKDKLDLNRLRKTILSIQPDLVLISLTGAVDAAEYGNREIWQPSWLNPWQSRADNDYNVESWPAYKRTPAIRLGSSTSGWGFPSNPANGGSLCTAEQVFRYTVLQAGAGYLGGGCEWNISPNPNGMLWEGNSFLVFQNVRNLMHPISESLTNVYPSTSYLTSEGTQLNNLPNGIVATKSKDNQYEYIHVLNPPVGKTLDLPLPKDGKTFVSAVALNSGNTLTLLQNQSGVHLTLSVLDNWNSTDFVIKLTATLPPQLEKNLAFHKPVESSSQEESIFPGFVSNSWGRALLVDGRINAEYSNFDWSAGNNGWSSKDNLTSNHAEWVYVDLGTTQPINRVDLYARNDVGMVGEGFPIDFTIDIANDNEHWKSVVQKNGYLKPTSQVQSFSFNRESARYVRVRATKLSPVYGQYRMQLSEFEIFNENKIISTKEELSLLASTNTLSVSTGIKNSQINYTIQNAGDLRIVIYNTQGKPVRTLLNGYCEAGMHTLVFDHHNDQNQLLSSGIYICVMRQKNYILTDKVIIIRQ